MTIAGPLDDGEQSALKVLYRLRNWQTKLMSDEELGRLLQSIGKACFCEFYELLSDRSISDSDAADRIADKWNCASGSALHRRVRPARTILATGRGPAALEIIVRSERVKPTARALAKALLVKAAANPQKAYGKGETPSNIAKLFLDAISKQIE